MKADIHHLFDCIERVVAPYQLPFVSRLAREGDREPFFILVATLLSARARDNVTERVVNELWQRASNPQAIASMPLRELEAILKPCGMFRAKARALKALSAQLVTEYGGKVPTDEAALLSLPGVGRKTANLVLAEAFGIPAICVDTHVQRIAQHLGLTQAKTALEVEHDLQQIVPRERWRDINRFLVPWGQYICKPRAKICSCKAALAAVGCTDII